MTVPAGDWDLVYDSSLGTLPVAQGWSPPLGGTPPSPTITDGYLQLTYNGTDGAAAIVLSAAATTVTFAARFRVVQPAPAPAGVDFSSVIIFLAYHSTTLYGVPSAAGLKATSDNGATFPVVDGSINFDDGEFHEVYLQWDPAGTPGLEAFIWCDGVLAWNGSYSLDFGGGDVGYSYIGPNGNYGGADPDATIQVDWAATSYDTVIDPVGGTFGEATISLGSSGATVEFDELALYAAPLDEDAILRHYQAGKGIAT